MIKWIGWTGKTTQQAKTKSKKKSLDNFVIK